MKRLIFLLVTTSMFFLYACKPKDADIKTGVDSAIANMGGVSANVSEGVVTLSGTVASEETRTSAESAAKGVKGVKSIVNNINVVAPVISGDDLLNQGLKMAMAAFPTVTASARDSVITLTGEISRADLTKVIQAAQELKPKKVDNQLTIK